MMPVGGGHPTEEGFNPLAKMGIGIVVDARFPKGGARSSEEAADGIRTDTLALSVSERQDFCSLPEAAPSESGEENILALPPAYQQYSLRPELI